MFSTTAIFCLSLLVFFICLSFLIFLQTIEANWRCGRHNLQRIQCRSENSKGVYCLQYDDDKIISGLRDNSIKVCVKWIWRDSFHLNTSCIVDEMLCKRLHIIIIFLISFTITLLFSQCNNRYSYTNYFWIKLKSYANELLYSTQKLRTHFLVNLKTHQISKPFTSKTVLHMSCIDCPADVISTANWV